jgi:predicted ATPase/DNA-binding SARP family transcriptional activator/class 3 adenylate cyclase
MPVLVRLLGPLEVLSDANPVSISGVKERALVVLLALHADRVVSAETLIEALWEPEPPPSAEASLRVLVSRVRKALATAGAIQVVRTRARGYLLDADEVDAHAFEQLSTRGAAELAAGRPREASATLAEALALWRGERLAETGSEALRAESARLEQARLAAMEARIEADLACGRHAELVGELELLCHRHPLRERLWAQWITCLYRCGRQADALGVYQRLRSTLAEELGIDPSQELRRLEAATLAQDPSLDWTPPIEPPGIGPEGAKVADEHTVMERDGPDEEVLPTGTVTFLLTDIAGSTQLLRQNDRGYAAALADHRRLLRVAFAAHGGREVDAQGDSFLVAFLSAGQAVAAAAEAQRSLAAQPWPDAVRVRVRMGLHSGEATVAGGGYVGLAVHRAARIAAAADGGQVLLSGATAGLLGDQLPPGTTLRHLGEHRLKDFPQPAPLYQLDIAGLPTRFAPPRSAPRYHPLPVFGGELLGRDGDLAALAELLTDARTRLVTVTGPGGIGKTRLALETARTVADTFSGGAVFVPLSAVTDARLVLSAIADAVDARREPGLEPLDAVRMTLGDDRTLLVLDNLEHVVDAACDISALLDADPAVVVLVTSRRVLRLRCERQFPLVPLAAVAAERLFAERAAAVHPGFRLDAANAAAVAEICRRIDGLPLAIELAAARVRLLPPPALLERLGRRLDVLADGPVDLPERQRTLRATMDWSFGLLGPHEQAVFTRLAVFSGGWTFAAAETVCGRSTEPDVLGALSALLDASLLVAFDETTPEPRLHMLETVRAYAEEKLAAAGDRAETERRHTDWLLALARSFIYADVWEYHQSLERLDYERANIRAAVQRAFDAADVQTAAVLILNTLAYLSLRDAQREASEWLDRIIPRSADAPAAVRARLLILRAIVAAGLDDITTVRPLLEEASPLLPDDADHVYDRGIAAMAGAFAAMAEGSMEEACRHLDDAAAQFTAMGHHLGVLFTTDIRTVLAVTRGDLEAAEQHSQAALDLSRRLGEEDLLGDALSVRGPILLSLGDVHGGRRAILDGAAINQRTGGPTNIVRSLEGLAAVALADDRPDVAARALAAAAECRRHRATALSPALTPLIEDLARRSRRQLGDQAYEKARAEAAQWSPLQALDQTLAEFADIDPYPAHHTDANNVPATDLTQKEVTGRQRA